jgi:hypothetical protein
VKQAAQAEPMPGRLNIAAWVGFDSRSTKPANPAPRKINHQFNRARSVVAHRVADQLAQPRRSRVGLEGRAGRMMAVPGLGHALDDELLRAMRLAGDIHLDAAGDALATRAQGRRVNLGEQGLQQGVVVTDHLAPDREALAVHGHLALSIRVALGRPRNGIKEAVDLASSGKLSTAMAANSFR